MVCKRCIEKPVIKISNNKATLCKSCFLKYFENKFKSTISKYKLIEKDDYIVAAISGGKDSTVLLTLLNKILNGRRDIKLTAIAIDEGIHDYRNKTLEHAKEICRKLNVDLKIYSYKDEFGKTLDEMLKSYKGIPCSICGVLRRHLLNKKSKELNATKLATGHNMDDESQSIIMNIFKSNMKLSARLGPITGVISNKGFVKRIKPLYFLSEKEVTSYVYLKGLMNEFNECPNADQAFRGEIRDMINNFEAKHEGTKNSIVNSFIEILPMLKEYYKSESEIKNCKICDEPCSKDICKACLMVKELVK